MKTLSTIEKNKIDNAVIVFFSNTNNEQAFSSIYKNYYQKVYAFVISKVKSIVTAQDITQECFIKAHQYFSTIKQLSSLKSWLFSIANNLCLNYFKKVKQEQKSVKSGNIELRLNLKESSEDLKEFFFAILDKYLPKIKLEDQQLLINKYIEQKSYEELSAQLKLSHSALKMRIKRAKEQIYTLALPEIKQELSY